MSGVCMIECIESRDCNVGERCIESRCTPENEDQASDMDLSPECRLNSDCLFAHVCTQERCVPQDGYCDQNSDCPDGQQCSRAEMLCVGQEEGCRSADDCFAGEVCVDRTCVIPEDSCDNGGCPVTCQFDQDCSDGEICEMNQCTAGCTERSCEAGELCREGRCGPECVDSNGCAEPYLCVSGECELECIEHSDCDEGLFCLKNRCGVECVDDSDCNEDLLCRDGRCEAECMDSSDCLDPLVCVETRCVPECVEATDCAEPLLCVENRCTPECTDRDDCPTDYNCVDQQCIMNEVPVTSPYDGTFLISSSLPIQRCNPTLSVNYDPRQAQSTHNGQAFTLFFPNPATRYLGEFNEGRFVVSWSGLNGADLNCGQVTTSNVYDAQFNGEDFFEGTLTVDFFFSIGTCNCRIIWPIIGTRL